MLLLDKRALPKQDLKECDPSVWLKVVLSIHQFQPKIKMSTFIWNCCHVYTIPGTWNIEVFFLTEEFVHFFIRKQFCTKLMKLSVLKIKSTFIEKQTLIRIGAIVCQSDRFYCNLSLCSFLKQIIYWSWQDLSSYQYQCDCQAVFVLPKVEWVGISVWIGKLVLQKVQQYLLSFSRTHMDEMEYWH